jgi:hypothetical protein
MAIKKNDELISKALEPLVKSIIPYVVRSGRQDLHFLHDNNRHGVELALGQMGACMRAFFELHTVYSQTRLTLSMAKRYPWRNGHPSRSEHLGFAWFQHVNLCYMFREKYKLSANRFNHLMGSFNRSDQEDVAVGLKRIDKTIGDFIRSRGQHVHEWNAEDEHVKFFAMMEFINQHKTEGLANQAQSAYGIAKLFLVSDIRKASDFMEEFILDSIAGYMAKYKELVDYFNDILEQLKTNKNIEIRVIRKSLV